jgi:phosphoserine phosphatase
MKPTADNSLVSEIRQRAMEISSRFHHSLREYGQYLREQQKKHPRRVVSQVTVVAPKQNSPS